MASSISALKSCSKGVAEGCPNHGVIGIWVLHLGRLSEKYSPSRWSENTKVGERQRSKVRLEVPFSGPQATLFPFQLIEQQSRDPTPQTPSSPHLGWDGVSYAIIPGWGGEPAS